MGDIETRVDVKVDAYLPKEYVSNDLLRVEMYKKIATIRSQDTRDDLIEELIDRFGEPPMSVQGLIMVALMRNTALAQGIYEIGKSGNKINLYIESLDMNKISALAAKMRGRITVAAAGKPHIAIKLNPGEEQLAILKKALEIMEKAAGS